MISEKSPPWLCLKHRPLHQDLRLGRGNRDILYVLQHRPLHQDVRRNTGKEREHRAIYPVRAGA